MRRLLIAFALLLLLPIEARAQSKPEIRPFAGVLVPTGDQRDLLQDAFLAGGQLAFELADRFHIVGTFGFAGPDLNQNVASGGHMHIYQADVGGELFKDMPLDNGWSIRPFIGLGGGVRTYDPTDEGGSKSYPAGYGALGSEFQMSRVAMRLEARDYLTQFKGLTGNDDVSTRNEVTISLGLAYHLR
ncbi:MAG TPA: hypothetical protein VFQ05_04005 [Candidatus Eisenbacteria bacterium]|nr:hypothetical protein [Candidatus Eisenbacteria bacterium]